MTKPATCERCAVEETDEEPLYELEIQLTDEYWMLCEPCIEDFTDWIENTANTDSHSEQ